MASPFASPCLAIIQLLTTLTRQAKFRIGSNRGQKKVLTFWGGELGL
jgi:hypothetical protein